MSKQLLITTPRHPQVAILENGRLCRLLSESEAGQVGDIYWAKVVRVLPALAVAFLDIGEDKNAILSLSDTPITAGQWLIVQLSRPAHANKGAIVSTVITLSLPCVVYKPNGTGVGVSGKLPKPLRQSLHHQVSDIMAKLSIQCSVVVRTSAQQVDETCLHHNIAHLHTLWQGILSAKATAKTPKRLYRTPLPLIALSDHADITDVICDDEATYRYWREFSSVHLPNLTVHQHAPSIFDIYNVYTQLLQSLDNHVDLPSGAFVIFEECEAMTVADVNTGMLTNSSKNVIYQANLEAIHAIAHELVLRQIGGLVVVDLIDMASDDDKRKIYQKFKELLAQDFAKVSLAPMSQFGLIELSRERQYISFSHQYTHACPTCQGTGKIKTLHLARLTLIAKLTTLITELNAKDDIILRVSVALNASLASDVDFQAMIADFGERLSIKIMTDYPDDKHDILQNKRR